MEEVSKYQKFETATINRGQIKMQNITLEKYQIQPRRS